MTIAPKNVLFVWSDGSEGPRRHRARKLANVARIVARYPERSNFSVGRVEADALSYEAWKLAANL